MKNLKIIFETKAGSHLYGTNTISSDMDYRGVGVVPIKDMLDPFQEFNQFEDNESDDRIIYGLKKFMKLASDMNPNVCELLYANENSIIKLTKQGKILLDNRNLFLSQLARKTFFGYAVAQLKRIELHKNYLLNPPKNKPNREDYGLPAMPNFGLEKIVNMIHSPQETIAPEWREYALKEKSYRDASDNYQKYEQWKNNRNPKRALLEEKWGYDLKHSNHLYRLLTEGRELLETGNIVFPLRNVDKLKFILNGGMTYNDLMEEVNELNKLFENCKSNLPNKPNINKLKELYYKILGI